MRLIPGRGTRILYATGVPPKQTKKRHRGTIIGSYHEVMRVRGCESQRTHKTRGKRSPEQWARSIRRAVTAVWGGGTSRRRLGREGGALTGGISAFTRTVVRKLVLCSLLPEDTRPPSANHMVGLPWLVGFPGFQCEINICCSYHLVSSTLSPLHANEFHSESTFIRPICS